MPYIYIWAIKNRAKVVKQILDFLINGFDMFFFIEEINYFWEMGNKKISINQYIYMHMFKESAEPNKKDEAINRNLKRRFFSSNI